MLRSLFLILGLSVLFLSSAYAGSKTCAQWTCTEQFAGNHEGHAAGYGAVPFGGAGLQIGPSEATAKAPNFYGSICKVMTCTKWESMDDSELVGESVASKIVSKLQARNDADFNAHRQEVMELFQKFTAENEKLAKSLRQLVDKLSSDKR